MGKLRSRDFREKNMPVRNSISAAVGGGCTFTHTAGEKRSALFILMMSMVLQQQDLSCEGVKDWKKKYVDAYTQTIFAFSSPYRLLLSAQIMNEKTLGDIRTSWIPNISFTNFNVYVREKKSLQNRCEIAFQTQIWPFFFLFSSLVSRNGKRKHHPFE